jgi:hypothetical protein
VTADVIPPIELARRRAEREQKRKEREAMKGSILGLIDDNNENTVCVASEPKKEKTQ